MHFDIVTLFPQFFHSFFRVSMVARAVKSAQISYKIFNIRAKGKGKNLSVDDTVYGGSHGMLLRHDVLLETLRTSGHEKKKTGTCRILLSPRGKLFSKKSALRLSQFQSICLICGHYEGVDARIEQEYADEVISIGDYVLFGGEAAATVLIESISRYLSGLFKSDLVVKNESHGAGLLEEDQYTRPFDPRVPKILLEGHHQKIEEWREENRLISTYEKRIDLIKKRPICLKELKIFLKYLNKRYSCVR